MTQQRPNLFRFFNTAPTLYAGLTVPLSSCSRCFCLALLGADPVRGGKGGAVDGGF